jgi:O-antigen/teichoic acid export membrane protein
MAPIRASIFWSALRNWCVRLGSVLVFFILARILPRDQLGLFAAAASIMAIADLVAENGLGDAVVQTRKVDARLLSGALAVNVLIGGGVIAVLLLGAKHFEHMLGVTGLSSILSAIAFVVLVNAFSYVPQSLLRREFQFKWLAMRALGATVISGVIGVIMAFTGWGVWSLVAQYLIAAVVNCVLVWWVKPWKLQLVSPMAAKPLFGFGSRTFASRILDYMANRSIEIAIVAGLGPAALALWVMASRLWAVLMQLISAVTMDVALPVFAKLAEDRDALHSAYYRSIQATAALGVPIFAMLAALAPEAMLVAFGDNGRGGATILMPVAILGAFQLLQYYNGTLLSAIGRPGVSLRILIVKAIAVLITLTVTFGRDLHLIALSFAAVQIALTPQSFYYGRKYVGYSVRQVVRQIGPFMVASTLMFGAICALRILLEPLLPSPFFRGAALGSAGLCLYLALIFVLDRRSTLRVIGEMKGGRRAQGAQASS